MGVGVCVCECECVMVLFTINECGLINKLRLAGDLCVNKSTKVVLSGLQYLMSGWLTDYSFKCQPVDYSNSPQALRVSAADRPNTRHLGI